LQPGFSDVLAELFDQIHRALVLSAAVTRNRGNADDLEPVLVRAGWMYFGHIGDSRIITCRSEKNDPATHTRRHSRRLAFANRADQRTRARTHPRRNLLQKALGGGNQFVDPQVGAIACERGDIFFALHGRFDGGTFRQPVV